jgi:hypothetical protein
MYAQQYPSAPPAYNSDGLVNQHGTNSNYHTTSEERMVDFQQLVARYESKIIYFEILLFCKYI